MRLEHLKLLRSPLTGKELHLIDPIIEGDHVMRGSLSDGEHTWSVVRGVPRFVEFERNDSFSVQWREHPEVMQTRSSGMTLYELRWKQEANWPAELTGDVILEAGCGVGLFTTLALATGATIVSFDLSTSVDVVFDLTKDYPNSLVVQASIYEMPFAKASFDRAFCFGVLQHTPQPRKSFESILASLKPGGRIATDIYADVPLLWRHHGMLRTKYAIRPYVKDIPAEKLHRWIKRYIAVAYPIGRMLQQLPGGVPLSQHLMIDNYQSRLTGMNPAYFREFAIVDILDMLGAEYDYPTTKEEYRRWHDEHGLLNIDVDYGYNGLEGRATKPPASA